MSWVTAVLTLVGTVVGASVTLAADRVRWRRDQDQRRYEVRRESYATYLAALHETSGALRAVSLGDHGPETSRQSAARTAFRSASLNANRERLVLVAPESAVRAADDTFTALRELRDLVGQQHDLESPEYQRVLTRYQVALKGLRNVMRQDLGSPPLVGDVTL